MDTDRLTDRLGVPVEVHGRIPNTTDRIRRLARDDAPHGTTVVADELTAARGRTGSAWSAPSGGVWTSTLLRPDFDADHVGRLTFAAGVAVADVVSSFGVNAELKWPNDVLVGGKKIAGILTESVHDGVPVAGKPVDEVFPGGEPGLDYVTLGIGINANVDPADLNLDRPATALRAETGGDVDRETVVVRLNEGLRERCAQVETADGFSHLLDDWRERSVTLGQRVVVHRRGQAVVEGVARDVTETGALVVDTGEERIEVTEGECRQLRRE
ncbi:BirA family transcriptional regulator, biotin operon repressor / biotin-[acetyl-CoA-carboxylase] ligase [Halogranum gelatinilyticum]|uniref:BirA family transcriptional regulator, biotin operon repressor / biotin-[acetyl-CoA-carboxylase] ligase n=1 Tax=Halogranum gelatinilyticum TaxID=660521 RepID=A0A1G9R788_9EURY|nr:biotin--[acetyl-CoA-carboxylase] ligase [Halogranum gelatinilyticum]SDM19159.1 BirA family transcriptional regulator, biotin operon repressor / biotin-[acetyl-CoA-carboxylase] ligase [Halogranum gelatinilyticum]